MTFTAEELQQIESIKSHIKKQTEKKGIEFEGEFTDYNALQYALGVTEIFIREENQKKKQTNKNKIAGYIGRAGKRKN